MSSHVEAAANSRLMRAGATVAWVLLGLLIWQDLFESTFWLIGTLLGIELIFNGWSWVMLGLAAKSIPEAGAAKPAGG